MSNPIEKAKDLVDGLLDDLAGTDDVEELKTHSVKARAVKEAVTAITSVITCEEKHRDTTATIIVENQIQVPEDTVLRHSYLKEVERNGIEKTGMFSSWVDRLCGKIQSLPVVEKVGGIPPF